MKMLDPTSVVRESEFATAATTGSYGEKVKAAVSKVITGERLSDAIRQDFVNTAQKLYNDQLDQYNLSKVEYRELAKRYGLNPDNVVIELSGRYGKEGAKSSVNPTYKNTPSIKSAGKRIISF
jgi:hypothetical protein